MEMATEHAQTERASRSPGKTNNMYIFRAFVVGCLEPTSPGIYLINDKISLRYKIIPITETLDDDRPKLAVVVKYFLMRMNLSRDKDGAEPRC